MYRSWVLFCTLLVCACATAPKQPVKTQLELRQFQSREMATADTAVVMKAVINVLQDEGFILKNADKDLGFLTATREIDIENTKLTTLYKVSAALSGSQPDATWLKNTVEECSANVSGAGDHCSLRVIFQKKTMDNKGGVVKVEQVDDEQVYQQFFSKMDKGLFLQQEGL